MKRAKNRSINEWGLFGKAVTVLLLFAVAALHTTCRPADEDDGLFPAPDAPKPVFSRAWDSTL
ncbi:MAG TPA: hypothetical protein PKB07_27910, partial [Flavilitoribacter sp.]|nr:hypothetical protein [Flavilitoribacter sp.]